MRSYLLIPIAIWYVAVIALGGCALMPNSIRPEIAHMSHVSQHFDEADGHNAINMAQVTVHWDLPKRFYVEATEGVALNAPNGNGGFGEISGPRDQFTARVGYVFTIH